MKLTETPEVTANNNTASEPGIFDRSAKKALEYLLADAGIVTSFDESADIRVHDSSFYQDVLLRGSMGLGDSYVEGKWDSREIDKVIEKILESGIYQKLAPIYDIIGRIRRRLLNLQNKEGSMKVIEGHYDLPASIYEAFLDPNLQYTCARFEGTNDLDEAQRIKMDNICRKLRLKPGDQVMDVGGGWGGLARFMANEYGAKPTVVTLSSKQAEYIRQKHQGKVDVFQEDYQEMPDSFRESFDAISAVGVLEHVGHKNYPKFMRILHGNLKEGGRVLIHSLYTPYPTIAQNPWVNRHIFPNGEIAPRALIEKEILQYFRPTGNPDYPEFEDLSANYPPTLHAWKDRLSQSRQAGKIQMSDKEFRKWIFYFMLYAGAIKAGHVKVGQFLYKK
jgi:cyclopropane-fatty-acyl-phospholipid synthase